MVEKLLLSDAIDLIRQMRDYLEFHNAPDALEGYFNDIAWEVNPLLEKYDIPPISEVVPKFYETD